jgi:hypothetical protein
MENVTFCFGQKVGKFQPFYGTRLCSVPDCTRESYAKGLCKRHHELKRITGRLFTLTEKNPTICRIDGCEKKAKVKGLCVMHNKRRRLGQPMEPISLYDHKGEKNPSWNGGISINQYPNHHILSRNRLEVLKEANYICQYCGGIATQTHHKDFSRDNHTKENLAPTCRSCNLKMRKSWKRTNKGGEKDEGQKFFD